MSRTTITKNGALTNEDGEYTLVANPTVGGIPYWVENYGWELQPFMTSVWVATEEAGTEDTDPIKIKLPNIKDVPLGHTIMLKFSTDSYPNRCIIDMGESEAEMHVSTMTLSDFNNATIYYTEDNYPHLIDLFGMGDLSSKGTQLGVLRFTKFIDNQGEDRWLFQNSVNTDDGIGIQDMYNLP